MSLSTFVAKASKQVHKKHNIMRDCCPHCKNRDVMFYMQSLGCDRTGIFQDVVTYRCNNCGEYYTQCFELPKGYFSWSYHK